MHILLFTLLLSFIVTSSVILVCSLEHFLFQSYLLWYLMPVSLSLQVMSLLGLKSINRREISHFRIRIKCQCHQRMLARQDTTSSITSRVHVSLMVLIQYWIFTMRGCLFVVHCVYCIKTRQPNRKALHQSLCCYQNLCC